jgi:hypothetical protein
MQPFGDRSKVVIEPMLTDQWFVDTAKIVEPALEAVRTGRTKIIPPSGEKTYYHWLENIEPWCISAASCGGGTRSRCGMGWTCRPPACAMTKVTRRWTRWNCASLATAGTPARRDLPLCADVGVVTEHFRDSLAALPHPLNHAQVVEVPFGSGGGACGIAGRLPGRSGCDEAGLPDLARPRRPRHLVLLRPLAHRHARLAGTRRRSCRNTSPPRSS